MAVRFVRVTDKSKLHQVFLVDSPALLMPAQVKAKSFESRRNSLFCISGADAPLGHVRAWTLCCLHSSP